MNAIEYGFLKGDRCAETRSNIWFAGEIGEA